MFRFILIWAGLAIAGLWNAGSIAGAEDPPAEPEASPKEWLAERQAEFAAYQFQLEAPEPRMLTLESRSLLNWSNAERGADVGAVFLWTDKGRPQLIASAFGREKLRHEFHSLSTEPIAGRRGEKAVHRFGPGIAWQELPEAPVGCQAAGLAPDPDATPGGTVPRRHGGQAAGRDATFDAAGVPHDSGTDG